MAVTQKLVTSNFRVATAANFIDSFANNDYFIYAARHIPYANTDANIPTVNNSVQVTQLDPYNDMVFAKRLANTNVRHMVHKYMWEANTYYDMYDHEDSELDGKAFFITVDDDTEYNVWKCLFNNSNSTVNTNSTVAPSRVGSAADLNPVETGDGYVWKYMYTITKSQYEDFATSLYVPIIANNDVVAGATKGTIEVIEVVNRGAGYNNYIASGTFTLQDINVDGIPTFYGAPPTAASIDDYYQGCVIKITSGVANGEYRRIVNYEGTSGTKKFIIDRAFVNTPAAGDTYEVHPYVFVWGDGSETTPAEGIAYIDSSASNSISRVDMLNVGEGYRYGESYPADQPSTIPASISSTYIQLPEVISTANGFIAASLRPILSPKDGHGSDPYNELFAKRVCISTEFNESESGVFSTENDYRQVGVIKNPLFHEVDINIANKVGPGFSVGEKVYQYRKFKLHGNVSITEGSTTIEKTNFGKISNTVTILNGGVDYDTVDTVVFDNTGTGGSGAAASIILTSNVVTGIDVTNQGSGYVTAPTAVINSVTGSNAVISIALDNPDTPTFKDSFEVGDFVLVTDGTSNFISTVANVPEDYRITTTSANSSFTADNCEISALVVEASGIVSTSLTNSITLANVAGVFTTGSRIIGVGGQSGDTVVPVSGTTAEITGTINVNDRSAGSFSGARQLTRLVGQFSSGSVPFLEDELVEQESLIAFAKPRGRVHHLDDDGGAGDDSLWLSNSFGIWNLDPSGVRDIVGAVSAAELTELTNKYPGDFVVGSGEVIYIENLDPIRRDNNKSEIIKIILEF